MKMYYNVKAHEEIKSSGVAGIAMHDISLPVEMLFNENDSCGEVMPLASGELSIQTPDGTVKTIRFEKGENIVLSHEDLSATPL